MSAGDVGRRSPRVPSFTRAFPLPSCRERRAPGASNSPTTTSSYLIGERIVSAGCATSAYTLCELACGREHTWDTSSFLKPASRPAGFRRLRSDAMSAIAAASSPATNSLRAGARACRSDAWRKVLGDGGYRCTLNTWAGTGRERRGSNVSLTRM